jgi:hypothetical protein
VCVCMVLCSAAERESVAACIVNSKKRDALIMTIAGEGDTMQDERERGCKCQRSVGIMEIEERVAAHWKGRRYILYVNARKIWYFAA